MFFPTFSSVFPMKPRVRERKWRRGSGARKHRRAPLAVLAICGNLCGYLLLDRNFAAAGCSKITLHVNCGRRGPKRLEADGSQFKISLSAPDARLVPSDDMLSALGGRPAKMGLFGHAGWQGAQTGSSFLAAPRVMTGSCASGTIERRSGAVPSSRIQRAWSLLAQ